MSEHVTTIEFDGFLYYWRCRHPDCATVESYHHMYRHAAEADAAQHVNER